MSEAEGFNKKTIEEGSRAALTVKAGEHFVRFSALANAGGAIMTVSILGATAKDGVLLKILALPLGLFSTGLVCALLMSFTVVIALIQKENVSGSFSIWLREKTSKSNESLDVGAILLFVLGCMSGVVIVAFS